MLVKRWVHFRWAVVLSCSFYTCLFKTICYICDFFSLSISVFFVLCIGIGMFVFVKNNYFQTDMIESTFFLSLLSFLCGILFLVGISV